MHIDAFMFHDHNLHRVTLDLRRVVMKVIWVDLLEKQVTELSRREVPVKALLADKLLYISDYHNESLLIVGRGAIHGLIFVQLADQNSYSDMSLQSVCGAGHIRNGKVIDWTSDGFGITTPRRLRTTITKVLTGLN